MDHGIIDAYYDLSPGWFCFQVMYFTFLGNGCTDCIWIVPGTVED